MSLFARRSVLFMPAVNERAITKIPQLSVDTVILDLEDAVLPDRKADARAAAVRAVATVDAGYRQILIRINGLDSPWWQDDLAAIAQTSAEGCGSGAGVVVPKIESCADIDAVVRVNEELGNASIPVWIMLETPVGVLAAVELCRYRQAGGAPVGGVLMGTADLAKCMRLPQQPDRQGMIAALSHCVLAAKAADVPIIDGVYMDIKDSVGLEAECVQGRNLGFDGKTLIHPAQLEITNRIFSPSPKDIEDAHGLIGAWAANVTTDNPDGSGVCVHNNKLVEFLHVEQARELIAYAGTLKDRMG